MRKPMMLTVLGVGAVLLLAVTNPNQSEYTAWLKQQAIQKAGGGVLATGIVDLFGGPLIHSATTEHNLVLFSIFTTKLDSKDSITCIGLLHHFVPLSQPQEQAQEN